MHYKNIENSNIQGNKRNGIVDLKSKFYIILKYYIANLLYSLTNMVNDSIRQAISDICKAIALITWHGEPAQE